MYLSDKVSRGEATQGALKRTGTRRAGTAANRQNDTRFQRPGRPLFSSVSPTSSPQREKRSCRGLLRRTGFVWQSTRDGKAEVDVRNRDVPKGITEEQATA